MNKTQKKEDSRKFPRLDVNISVKYRLIGDLNAEGFSELGKTIFEKSIRNISPAGVAIATEERLPVGVILELEFFFPEASQRIKTLAKVIWSKDLEKSGKYVSGMKYVAIKENQLDALSQFTVEYLVDEHKAA